MSTLLVTLASYVPALITRRATPAPLDAPRREALHGAVLFADISGFTALTERLAQHGPAGVETLTRLINRSFEQMLDEISTHGGDVVKFAGDALLAVWIGEPSALAANAQCAAACALGIQRRMTASESTGDLRLTLRIGIAAGALEVAHIGGVYGRWEFVIAGRPLAQVAAAEHQAAPGQVVLAPDTWPLIAGWGGGQVLAGGGVLLEQMCEAPPAAPPAPPTLVPGLEGTLRSYIPGAVISRLVAEQSGWLAELRRVTVLFVSLPELDHNMTLARAQTVMRALQTALYRYEGSVNKIGVDDKGATLVAALGLPPLAHEDDAARGVQAALAMQAALQSLGLRSAVGVATGRAFCGEVGSSSRREYTLIGDVVNLAARLMQAASDSILCDAATVQAAQGAAARSLLTFEPLPALRIKGKAEPVAVYRPQIMRSAPLAVRPPVVSNGEMIGRGQERAVLIEQLHALLRGGAGGVVMIEGEAGIGKSCLLTDLRHRAEALRITTLGGTSDALEQSTPYFAWRGLFSQLLDLENLPTAKARRRHILDLLEDEPDLQARAPLLNTVIPLDLPDTDLTRQLIGPLRASATRELLLSLLHHAVARAPKLLLLEDAHWMDSLSWALALAVCEQIRGLLLVMTLRPLHQQHARQPGGTQPAPLEYESLRAVACAHLRLDMLPPDDLLALVARRLGVAALPAQAAALIVEKAQGNPFFSEELAYALRDAGLLLINDGVCQLAPDADLRALNLPETVQGAIISRIDRLSPSQQLTLKVASVIGRVFQSRVVQAIYPLDGGLRHVSTDLAALDQLDLTPLEVPEPELSYIFKHAITQDVVYNLMLFAQRRQLHRAVAEWYEQTHALDTPWLWPLLGYHWSRADVAAKAIDYFDRAGQHALTVYALQEARSLFEQALELVDTHATLLPNAKMQQITLNQLLGETHHMLGDMQIARMYLNRALTLARAAALAQQVTVALIWVGRVLSDMGLYDEARVCMAEALPQARALHDQEILARALMHFGNVAFREGQFNEMEQYYAESLAIYTALDNRIGIGQSLFGLGGAALGRGQYADAERALSASVETHRALGDHLNVSRSSNNLGWVCQLLGRYTEAQGHFTETLAICTRLGDKRGMAYGYDNLGFIAWHLGDQAAAYDYFIKSLHLTTVIGLTPLTLELLVGMALLQEPHDLQRAAELVGLARQHPATNTDVRMQSDPLLERLAAALGPDALQTAMQRGAILDLAVVVADLLG